MPDQSGTPEPQHRWENYVCYRNSREELAAWARRLKYFRFMAAFGTDAGDPDSLTVRLRVETQTELEAACAALGLPLQRIDLNKPIHQRGKPYPAGNTADLQHPMPYFPAYLQLEQALIHGIKVSAYVDDKPSLVIHVNEPGTDYAVDEIAVQNAETLEPLLESLNASIIDPPYNSSFCVCPKFYPELWTS